MSPSAVSPPAPAPAAAVAAGSRAAPPLLSSPPSSAAATSKAPSLVPAVVPDACPSPAPSEAPSAATNGGKGRSKRAEEGRGREGGPVSAAAAAAAPASAAKVNDASDDESAELMIRCDVPSCLSWHRASDLDPPLSPRAAEKIEVWHCPRCAPYHGPGRTRGGREGLRKRKRIDFRRLNDPGLVWDDGGNEPGRGRGNAGASADEIREVDFADLLRRGRRRGLFEPGETCLLKLRKGERFDGAYASKHGFDRPALFKGKPPSELGLRLPRPSDVNDSKFTYEHVSQLVGPYRTVQVLDCATQLTTEYTLEEWAEYMAAPEEERTRVLNVITLEVSDTPLGELVTEPTFARELDFAKLHWPKTREDVRRLSAAKGENGAEASGSSLSPEDASKQTERSNQQTEQVEELEERLERLKGDRPRVSKYCLQSAAGSYTDFHVDFGGTSVWYHVCFGKKAFYFVEPTEKNLRIYARWATGKSGKSGAAGGGAGRGGPGHSFLPDLIRAAGGRTYEVSLDAGDTLFIPSGWIHAVYTPVDALVFGGNFLHRHSLEMQLRIHNLERKMKVGRTYRYPHYRTLMGYAARDFLVECRGLLPKRNRPGTRAAGRAGSDDALAEAASEAHPARVLRGYAALAREMLRWTGTAGRAGRRRIGSTSGGGGGGELGLEEDVDAAREVARRLGALTRPCAEIGREGRTDAS
ncbi:hypothetical protein ACHAWF_007555 [Thalassiosira exigua]